MVRSIALIALFLASRPVRASGADTPIGADSLDPRQFAEWVEGSEGPIRAADGPGRVLWTDRTAPAWDGVRFGDTRLPGPRHLRIGFKAPVPVGSVLVRGGGRLSVLRGTAAGPGDLSAEEDWLPARRIVGDRTSGDEVGAEEYAVWVLPPGTTTRALRFSHEASPADPDYAGWLGGAFVLGERVANVAPRAVASAGSRDEAAPKINNGSSDKIWDTWDNGPDGRPSAVSPGHPEWVTLTWPGPEPIAGLVALWAGFGAAEVQAYDGPAGRHPREAAEADWSAIRAFEAIEPRYPLPLGVNRMDFGRAVTTRAIRVRITRPAAEAHPHLVGKTRDGRRVWLGELMALRPLGDSDLETALPGPLASPEAHPPIPVRFTLKEPGLVTLVIEDNAGKRVRNLVSETPFPAGANVAWWDGMDDLLRDEDAAKHGLYHIPSRLVESGHYRVRGLARKPIELRYELSAYTAGNPPWSTPDHKGGWLANHTPPSSVLFVPAESAPGGKPLIYLGSYVSEGGDGLAWVDLDGRKQGGVGWVGGNWTGAQFLARDAGPKAVADAFAYAGSAWEGDLRLTALTPAGDRPVIPYKLPGGKEGSVLAGLAARDGRLVCSLPKQGRILFVDASAGSPLGTIPLDDPRGLAFDDRGRLLALSGRTLLRFTLPENLSGHLHDAVARLDRKGWKASPDANLAKAGDALDGDRRTRWDSGTAQVPGQSFLLDLGEPRGFSRITLDSGPGDDFPRGFEVHASADAKDWGRPIAGGAGAKGRTIVEVPRRVARYLKVVQTGRADNFWSLYELDLDDASTAGGPASKFPAPEVLVDRGLDDPQQLALDARGNFYVSDRGSSHQVKVFDPDGKPLRAIGHPGAPKAGPYDPDHMNNPNGLAIDGKGRLWVAETDFQPKRVGVWTLDGERVDAFYGPAEYGGGGALDPVDRTRFYYHGMELILDWERGRSRVSAVLNRPGPGDLAPPEGFGVEGQPETALYRGNVRYFTNAYNSNPTNGAPIALLWQDRGGIARPVAAMGRARSWAAIRPPAGTTPGDPLFFAWSDLDGDAHIQPGEVTFQKADSGGITVMPDLAFVAARVGTRALRFAPKSFTDRGVPVYDLIAGETLVDAAQAPTSSGGDQAIVAADGRVVLTVAPGPFAPQSIGGAINGVADWSYPNPWPGLHASHESAVPDRPGQVIGATRLLGGFVTPKGGDAGPVWGINGNMGNMYLFTSDGLFLATLFKDVRQGKPWAMPAASRGMRLDGLTLHDENFWPSMAQASDGKIYLVAGNPDLVRVDGLESVVRLPGRPLIVSSDDLKVAQAYLVEGESRRQRDRGTGTLTVALRPDAPVVDGDLGDWAGAEWADVDKRGVAANFNSDSKPYDVSAAVAVAGDRLFAAFRTGEADLLRNSGEAPAMLFKTGGALDLMIGADPKADPGRRGPARGDVRLLVALVGGKPMARLYRAVVPDTTDPVPFSSPWRTVFIDRVEDLSGPVRLAGRSGNYELSIPLAALGLDPTPGSTIRADIGVLRGDGSRTTRRVYWQNKASGLTADVPSEAMLTPELWGRWRFEPRVEDASKP